MVIGSALQHTAWDSVFWCADNWKQHESFYSHNVAVTEVAQVKGFVNAVIHVTTDHGWREEACDENHCPPLEHPLWFELQLWNSCQENANK